MGLFRKKSVSRFKDYSLNETISLLKQPKYQGYAAVEVGEVGRYKIIPEKEVRQHIDKIKEVRKNDKSFADRLSNNGEYRSVGNSKYENVQTPKYGDYQASNKYDSTEWSR